MDKSAEMLTAQFLETFFSRDHLLCDRQRESDRGRRGGSPRRAGSWSDHRHQEESSSGPALHQ